MSLCPGSFIEFDLPHGSYVKCPKCGAIVETEPFSGYQTVDIGARWIETVKIVAHP